MKYRRIALAVLVMLLPGVLFAAYSEIAPSIRAVMPGDDFVLTLSADRQVYAVGERPKLTLTLKNNSPHTVTLVAAVDGSTRGRYPWVHWAITPPPGALPEEQWLTCGNTNPLQLTDFRLLPAGESMVLCSGDGWGVPAWTALDRGPGEYSVRTSYSTEETDLARWIGGPLGLGQEHAIKLKLGALLGQVPRFTATSNDLRIRFDGPQLSTVEILETGTLEQAVLALRTLEQAPQSVEGVPGAILKGLTRFHGREKWEQVRFAEKALPLLASTGTSEDLDQFWRLVLDELQKTGSDTVMTEYSVAEGLVRAVLRMPQPQREERLLFLFTSNQRGRSPLIASPGVLELLGTTPGADVEHCLERLAVETQYPSDADLYRRLLSEHRQRFSMVAE